MTLRGDAFGTLQILKTSDDGAVSGIAFTVTNNTTGESQTVTTGTDGSITLDNLVAGSYTVTETVPTAYVNEVSSQTVTVSAGETATVGFLNCLKRFRVQLTKQETDTDIVVADAVYGLYHQGTLVDRYTTDENGQFTTDYYPCGEGWTIQELEAPRGYALDETVYDLSVAPQVFTQASNTVEMSVCDDPIPGSITVLKADSTGKPLAGAVFLLEYSTDGTTWQPVESRTGDIVTLGGCTSPGLTAGQLTTGSDGTVVFIGLRADGFIQYRLTETKAPPGYNLMADTIYQGTLPTQGNSDPLYEIAFTVQDGVTTSLPMTGSNGLWLVTMGTVLAGLAVIAGYFYIIQKEKTK
jgi:LPXTG-motif cell wall-anchored protein